LAVVSSGGAIMALESIDKRIRGIEAFTHVLGCRPMAVIPYIPIQDEGIRKHRLFRLAAIAGVVAFIATLLALHFLYMPLDMLIARLLARLG